MKTSTIDLKDLEDFIKLLEAQHRLTYHLQKYKEAIQERLKELEKIKVNAQTVMNLKGKFKAVSGELKNRLSESDTKTINSLMHARYIRI